MDYSIAIERAGELIGRSSFSSVLTNSEDDYVLVKIPKKSFRIEYLNISEFEAIILKSYFKTGGNKTIHYLICERFTYGSVKLAINLISKTVDF